ncbi:MAG: hypothetical protein ACOYYU_13895 [Chloroflexota bacterium]
MTEEPVSEQSVGKPKRRLDYPAWRIVSILVTLGAAGVLAYSVYKSQTLVFSGAVVFFLLLWLIPPLWDWIVFTFGRKPETTWERISLNLALAMLAAMAFEDAFEVVVRLAIRLLFLLGR